ncbi:MAG: ubiquitin-like domain-containing protein [Dorea sp.]
MDIKRIIFGICAAFFLWTGIAYAEEETKTIVEYKKMYEVFDGMPKNNPYAVKEMTKKYKVPLEKLVKQFPSSYPVRLEGEDEWISIPVEWECTDDYENVMYGIYTFIVKPQNEQYQVSSDLEIMDIPCIEVTISSETQVYPDDIQVVVEVPGGEMYVLKLRTSGYIYSIQSILEEITGIPVNEQMIYFGDKVIGEDYTIEEYGILHGSVLRLVQEEERLNDEESQKPDDDEENADSTESEFFEEGEEIELTIVTQEVELDDQVQIQKRAVKTGDTVQGVIWVTLLIIALSVVGVMAGLKIKKRE